MTPVFVYGQLKFHRYQRAAFGRALTGTRAFLPGYERIRIPKEFGGYFNIKKSNRSRVRGLRIELTPSELKRCDRYERGYRRHTVRLADGRPAEVYIWSIRNKR